MSPKCKALEMIQAGIQSVREKKDWLIRNAHFSEVEFAFFSFVPESVQHTCLDAAIEVYRRRIALRGGSER